MARCDDRSCAAVSLPVHDAAFLQLAIAADASLAKANKTSGAAARTCGIDYSG